MPFVAIPNLSGPTFGGFIYGLNFKRGYDESPSTCTLSIVNERGTYVMPTIFSKQTVKIGDFEFNGEVLDYEFTESPDGKTLDVTIVEDSILLDRLNVVLFRRGLANVTPTKILKTKTKTIDRFVPSIRTEDVGGFSFQIFEFFKVTGEITVGPREVYACNKKLNNGLVIIGEEEYISNSCSIPESKYNLSTLMSTVGIIDGVDPNPKYKQSYEGSLRSVLQSWCADFGLSFFWKNGRIQLIDLKAPVADIPDISDCGILRKTTSQSGEGTFQQNSLALFQKEGSDAQETSLSSTSFARFNYNAYGLETINASDGDFGEGRTEKQFRICCLLSYFYEPLRKYYIYYVLRKPKLLGLNFIASIEFDTLLSRLVQAKIDIKQFNEFRSRDPLGEFGLFSYDSNIESRWVAFESEVASNFIGKYYRGPQTTTLETLACSPDSFVKYSVTATPGGEKFGGKGHSFPWANMIRNFAEGASEPSVESANVLNSQIVFTRGGQISHSQDEFLAALGLNDPDVGSLMESWMPKRLDLSENVAIASAIRSFAGSNAPDKLSLFFFPNKQSIDASLQIGITPTTGQNDRESTSQDPGQSAGDSCYFEKFCQTEEEEEEEQINDMVRQAGRTPISGDSPNNPYVEGLSSASAFGISVSLRGRSGRFYLPSEQPYTGFSQSTSEIRFLPTVGDQAKQIPLVKIFGNVGSLNEQVAEVRYIIDNATTETLDKNQLEILTADEIARAGTMSQIVPRKTISYNTAQMIASLPMDANSGLESLNITFSDREGYSCNYVYATRPEKIPKPDTRLRIPDLRINKTTFRK